MTTITGQYLRDANYVPITAKGVLTKKVLTTNANNTTSANPIFTVTGAVEVLALYGIVTTTLGSAQTVAFWRTNDGTAQAAISLATGTTISGAVQGSMLVRSSVASVALALKSASAGAVQDPVAATAPDVFMPFAVLQKTGAVTTNIEFVYTTTNAPTTGEITFYCWWIPLTESSSVVAV